MEPPTKHKEEEPGPRPPFAAAAVISRIAVAQICLTVGYAAAEPAALRSLSDVAGRYIEILARSAASIAAVHGRTKANLLDLVRAMEELSLPRGFAGASDPTRPLLRSSVLRELMAFVRSVDEIPFPRPIRRESVRAIVFRQASHSWGGSRRSGTCRGGCRASRSRGRGRGERGRSAEKGENGRGRRFRRR